ncbi:Vacuolar protein sorting-associated protein 13A [Hypsibius exemplaris]|uniref:Vacuolar protein sorting-associated protein 13A n=1 Tax=Hypsibius exemplaris TaxID=2072580 RepID=A0A1W0X5L9_HYPEX|nr:Vacuolar protein sorting-associated protein 13A [Hypsibius exemplaris]
MVLESIVAELLNRYLGDFVVNLDPKQLNLGIWGGDVKLSNLQLKSSALDDLDLPFKITHGRLSNLVLKIPWKNLYKQPVVVTVSGLYLVAVPKTGVVYNKEKEEKEVIEAKQRQLRRLEDAKKLHKGAGDAAAAQNDSFVEKMAQTIIKNLQVDVSDIHIRFEDRFTSPTTPFACGVTLKKLRFVTTEESWKDLGNVVTDASKFIYKLVTVEALSLYWTPALRLSFDDMNEEELMNAFKENIAEKDKIPSSLAYILEPIHLACNLRLNPKPELDGSDFQIPKIDLRLNMEALALSLSRRQYEGIVLFADALDTMTLKSKYRKYMPSDHPVKQGLNAKEWWQYAKRCVLEADVKPRLEGWSWSHIKVHREKLRRYRILYATKLVNAKPAQNVLDELEILERELSIFNILLMRQQAELDAKKLKPTVQEQKTGWFGWMTGRGKQPEIGEGDLEKKLADIMTPEEKKKLYEAIDYKEGGPIAMYPTTFVENRFDFKLNTLALSVVDDAEDERSSVLVIALNDVQSQLEQRPSAGGLKVNAAIKGFNILGTDKQARRPELMSPVLQDGLPTSSLLEVLFETKPQDIEKEYRLNVVASPVKAIYDAETINDIAKFFKPPESLQLKQLQVTAAAKFQELRESSTAGLRYALEVHKEIDLDIHLNASYFIVPENGIYTVTATKLIVDLGDIRIGNIDVPDRALKRGEENMEKLEASLYDKYSVAIQKIQIIFAKAGENWEAARKAGSTPLHILQPLSCALEIHQCILQNDPKRPMLRMIGELPSIAIHITEERVLQLCRLALSVPLPESAPEAPSDVSKDVFKKALQREAMSMARSNKDLKVAQGFFLENSMQDEGYQNSLQSEELESTAGKEEIFFDAATKSPKAKRRKSFHNTPSFKSVDTNFTSFHMQFRLTEVSLSIYRGRSEIPLVKCVLADLITEVYTRTFDMEVGLALVDLVMDYTRPSTRETVKMLRRHQGKDDNVKGVLLRLDYIGSKSNAPDFSTNYNNTLMRLNADFVGMDIVLDREGLVEMKQFATELQEQVNALIPTKTEVRQTMDEPDIPKDQSEQTILVGLKSPGVIQMDITAKLHMLTLSLQTGRKELAFCALKDISAHVVSDSEKMDVVAQLKRIKLKYPLALGLYPHIIRSVSDEVLAFHYIGYTAPAIKTDVNSHDMSIQLTLGAVEIVFLNKFVVEILDFAAGFSTAQAKLKEATSAATETAMQSLQSAYSDAVRIKMDISIRAPVVIMPQNSRSNNALLVDLGTLVLSNRFVMTPEHAVMENLKLTFAAVKFSRITVLSNQTIIKEVPLLYQPQAMEISVVRNLSTMWFTGAPDITVVGGLNSLELRLSKFDYTILMAVLAENFAESSPPAPPPPPRSPVDISPLVTHSTTSQGQVPAVKPIESPVKVPPTDSRLTKIKVDFLIGKISAKLYLIDLPDIKQMQQLEQTEALCGAEIIGMDAQVVMFNDNSMVVNATLGNITLDDLRAKSQNRPHRMLERKRLNVPGNIDHSKMLAFTLQQFPNSDKTIDVIVANIQCNLAMSFYLGLLEFITPVAQDADKPVFEISEVGTSVSSDSLHAPGGLKRHPSRSSPKEVTPTKAATQSAPPVGIMRINVSVEHPEIILIENASLKDSRILVLKTELSFKMTVTPDTSNMDLACNQLQVFLTTYEKRTELLKQILLPVEIGLHGSTPFGGNQKLAISMGYINLTISPVAVQTILGVLSSMGQTGSEEIKVVATENHGDLWKPKPIDKDSHWFLDDNADEEWLEMSVEQAIDTVVDDVFSAGDQLTLNTESIVVVLETTYGLRTVPMLLVEAKLNCNIEDFSRKMHLTGLLELEVAYYNDAFDVWEPLLEPVEDIKAYRPWQAQLEVRKNITANENVQALARMAASANASGTQLAAVGAVRRRSSGSLTASSSVTSVSEATDALKRTAAMTVSLSSLDSLQLTVSKRTLDVLSKMGESFTSAISSQEMMKVTVFSAPYVIYNDTGLDLLVTMTGTLQFGDPAQKEYLVKQGEKVDLFLVDASQQLTASVLKMQERMSVRPPTIQVKVGEKTAEILVSRAETRFFFIENPKDHSKPFRLIAEIQSEMGHKEIILRSTMQVENMLPTAVSLFYSHAGKIHDLGVITAGGIFNVPISLVQNNELVSLIYKPLDYEHVSLSEGISLEKIVMMANDAQEKLLKCTAVKQSPAEKIDDFYFNAYCKYTNVRYNNTHTVTPNSRLYQVFLKPVFSVCNLLPVPVHLQVEGTLEEGATLSPGGSASVCNARVNEGNLVFRIDNFGEQSWFGKVAISSLLEEMVPITMTGQGDTFNLGLRNVKEQGTTFLSIYAPVWIMNKTGLSLSYKDPIIHHRPDMFTLPILFGGKTLNSKKRVAVKAEDSEWSEKFSLDTVGSSGTLSCPKLDGTLAYEFGVSIKASAAVLTRLVVITPYHLFNNNADVDLMIREEHADGKWVTLPKNSTQPFWPQYLSKNISVKIAGSGENKETTTVFRYDIMQTILLRLDGSSYGGIYVQTHVSESNVTCSLSLYRPGTATALLINDTRFSLTYKQVGDEMEHLIAPQCQQLFTWPHPALPIKERNFVWSVTKEENKPLDLNRDDAGICYVDGSPPIFWVAFLDGVQRVLLFTDRQIVAIQCSRSLENEISNIEINLSLDAIGLSLVHNTIKREVLYIGIVSPGPIWMGRKTDRTTKKLKPMTGAESAALESAYQQHLIVRERDSRISGKATNSSIVIQEGEYEISFDSTGPALMTKPRPREIQRTHQPGLWCRVRRSDHHNQFHLKMHRIQLDNPIMGSRYPVVMYPVPLPSTADYKPFIEVSVVLRSAENSAVTQYKLLTTLIQEFEFRLDQAFLNGIIGMFSADVTNSFQERTKMLERFRSGDLAEVNRNLVETVAKGQGEEGQAYYERLMLQPIKIHLSFSLTGGHVEKKSGFQMPAEFITLFIKSIGVSVTEANDVILKLGTFERDYQFYTQAQLVAQVQGHYVSQVMKQLYVLVFGLDILGNPFGLLRGVTDGVKDLFYEPYLGAVEGPDEFMAGMSTGLKNFVGGTLGGTMGAVGRVTGTLGRAMAALSFDQEFQERRQAELNRNTGDFAGGMASSGRHLVSGFVEGVTGVVRRPMEGAKEEGLEGFVKGLGKGLLGFVARPTTGIIDFASGSLNTIGRAVKGDTTVQWLRMPRFIPSDGIIRPYNVHQAEGGLIFKHLKNGEYAKTDEYISHLITSRDRRYILMLTHKRVFCLEKGDVIHDWNIDWNFTIDQMPQPPKLDDKGLCVYVTDDDSGKPLGGLFSRTKKSKRVFIEDRDSGKWFCNKVQALWNIAHGPPPPSSTKS